MLEQPESPSVSQTKQQVFDHYLYRLQSEIHTILSAESGYEGRVNSLENELEVFKRACFTAENEKRLLSEEVTSLKQKAEALESQRSSEKRIVCLIDGNGTMFSVDLLTKGQEGGRLAAKLLSESVHFHLTSEQPCHLWTYVFFNKSGLLDMFAKAGGVYKEARDRFEEFLLGFNQSCERFVMTDVGNDDETAVAKMKVHLDFHARSQETYRVVFGGCHNDAYMSQLHSLQLTSLYRERLVLLPGYTDMTSEIKTLQLPSLIIPGLFVPDKIVSTTYTRQSVSSGASNGHADGSSARYGPPPGLPSPGTDHNSRSPTGSSTPPPPPPYPDQPESITDSSDVIQVKTENSAEGFLSSSRAANTDRRHRVILGHAAGPVSYRPLAQRWPQDHLRPTADSSAESTESIRGGANKGLGKQRKINREIPLSQHNPPPCTLFYLAANGCKHGPDCRFGHDYALDDEDYDALRMNAKRVPCPAVNRGSRESLAFLERAAATVILALSLLDVIISGRGNASFLERTCIVEMKTLDDGPPSYLPQVNFGLPRWD